MSKFDNTVKMHLCVHNLWRISGNQNCKSGKKVRSRFFLISFQAIENASFAAHIPENRTEKQMWFLDRKINKTQNRTDWTKIVDEKNFV